MTSSRSMHAFPLILKSQTAYIVKVQHHFQVDDKFNQLEHFDLQKYYNLVFA